jgi:cytochrome c biogenesis protein CcmG, thiol:disulfide interchange protein DsbE
MTAVAPAAPNPQKTQWRIAVIVVVTLAAAWAGWTALRQPVLPDFVASAEPAALPARGELPAVSLEQFEGLLVGQRGRPVVVNIWASWCAPCRTEMPLLDDAARSYGPDVVILGVASKDDPAEARRFLDDLDITYPNVFDESGQVRVALGLTAYPTTYVFGADGRLRARVDGGISEQRLAGLVEDALR